MSPFGVFGKHVFSVVGHFELLLWPDFALPLSAILSESRRGIRAPKRTFKRNPRKRTNVE
jgi:hypothetical protein